MALLWAGQFTKSKDQNSALGPESEGQAEEQIAIRPPSFGAVNEINGALRIDEELTQDFSFPSEDFIYVWSLAILSASLLPI